VQEALSVLPLNDSGGSADDRDVDLNGLLRTVVEIGASDLHLKVGQPPIVRTDGALVPVADAPPLDSADLRSILEAVCSFDTARVTEFDDSSELDTAYQEAGLPRFRVNAYRQRGEISFAFRVIPNEVPTFEKLRLPPGVRRLAENHKGLVLVTGATGSGKTTTLASIVGHINRSRKQHIVTIEDPIEVLHDDEGCIVNQREVGLDTASFGQALRRALRQDPDVILIGELRDSETAETALQAAESGHLVLSTMHTVDAAETVSRMIEFFPAIKHNQIRAILAGVLCGVVSQRLLPKIDGGRVAAVEVMVNNKRIEELIRENRADEIPSAIEDGAFFEMQSLPAALIDLVIGGHVDRETAATAAPNRHDFLILLDRAEKARAVEEAARATAMPDPEEEEEDVPRLRLIGTDPSQPQGLAL
jgi:twitching motility protein PilT